MTRPTDSPVELSDELRALAEAARHDGPTPDQLSALAARLGPLLPPTPPDGSAPPSPPASPASPPAAPAGPALSSSAPAPLTTAALSVLSPGAMLVGAALGFAGMGALWLAGPPATTAPPTSLAATTRMVTTQAPRGTSSATVIRRDALPVAPRPTPVSSAASGLPGDRGRPAVVVPPAGEPASDLADAPSPDLAPDSLPDLAPDAPASAIAPSLAAPDQASAIASAPAPDALAPTSPPITTEIALITRAQTALASSPATALALASEHAQTFPRGTYTHEREFIVIEALTRLGRTADARSHARQFRQRYPQSAYLPRLDTMLPDRSRDDP